MSRLLDRLRSLLPGWLLGGGSHPKNPPPAAEAMRTLIFSDLHLGNGQECYEIFAGADALPAFLDRFRDSPTRVVLNGDTFDFLMNEDPLELSVQRAVAQALAIATHPATAEVLAALGRILAGGGEVLVRLGNHDLELALPQVQEVIRQALRQPEPVSRRMSFDRGEQPSLLNVGGARLLVTHGEHGDDWNRVDLARLPGAEAAAPVRLEDFVYPPGSLLVKKVLNPLKRQYGLRFVGLLAPEFQGSALAALAVEPRVVRLVLQSSTVSIAWRLWRSSQAHASFGPDSPAVELGLDKALASAGLTEEELRALEQAGEGIADFSEPGPVLAQARLKLAREAFSAFARMQRQLVGTAGEDAFLLSASTDEVEEARRLAEKFNAGAVITGHTHRARWHAADGLVFANTGTWAWRMRLPPPEAPDDTWAGFLWNLRSNPGLDPKRPDCVPRVRRLTAVLAKPHPEGGAWVSLVECLAGTLHELGKTRVPPRSGS